MAAYREERLDVNGIDTAVFSTGEGDPLVFFHGAGTVTGFDCLLPLAERFRLIVPHHPGFGVSADDPSIDSIHDYVLHYLDLFDLLGLREFSLAGISGGGYMAATLAIEQTERVRRLVLGAPLGLRVPEHPTVDLFSIPDQELLSYLTVDMSIFEGKVPMPPTPEFLAERYRESTSWARVAWNRPYDIKLPKWLHRLTMPTLILWGDADRLIPVGQAAVWAEHIPGAEVKILPGVGHLMFDESREAVDAVAEFVAEGAGVLAKEA
jgi:pimeloyl-ACP methyl ester carboxylesterase